MGMSMNSMGGGGGRRGGRRRGLNSEINVTPFVDVMLVLLIVLRRSSGKRKGAAAFPVHSRCVRAIFEEERSDVDKASFAGHHKRRPALVLHLDRSSPACLMQPLDLVDVVLYDCCPQWWRETLKPVARRLR